MAYFDQALHRNACQNDLTIGIAFLIYEGLLSIILAGCTQLVKILLTHESQGIQYLDQIWHVYLI